MDQNFGRGLRVLVIDDEKDICTVVKMVLENRSFEVDVAYTLADARALRKTNAYDVMLVDKNLPDGTGLRLAEDVVAESADCEVIIITAYASAESAVQAMQLGVSDYITKPFHIDAVETRVHRVVQTLNIRRQNASLLFDLQQRNQELESIVQHLSSLVADRSSAAPDIRRLGALDRFIANRSFEFVYQPILTADHEAIVAYEALCRPTSEAFDNPTDLLATAARAGRMHDLGRALRDGATAPMEEMQSDRQLFVNIHPLEFSDSLVEWAEANEKSAAQVILEITHVGAIQNTDLMNRILPKLDASGFKICLDGLPTGYGALRAMESFHPAFVKMDVAVLEGSAADKTRDRAMRHVMEVAAEEDTKVIIQKIESARDLEFARKRGCDLVQGHLFAEPGPPFPEVKKV